ncbi:hypothetical protein [Deinococcus ruber]|uniref:Uncharacterized protein n=1 Tax=Deinococcus ruber TaxID=1848197 RepID=A0A918F1X2_9DEIO|nr:hypothetical protein [Deinococcus ruber]GGR00391.1 hypothetical protein GCM10008957_11480 [Deinococcus ruber]
MPTSLLLLAHVIRDAAWELFAALAALFTLISGLALLFYPGVYELSKSYATLQHLFPNPHIPGAFAVLTGLGVFLYLDRPFGRWAAVGVVIFQALQFFGSLASVGLSGGTVFFLLFLAIAMAGLLKSGGILPVKAP